MNNGCGGCRAKKQITSTLMDRIKRTNLADMANINKNVRSTLENNKINDNTNNKINNTKE